MIRHCRAMPVQDAPQVITLDMLRTVVEMVEDFPPDSTVTIEEKWDGWRPVLTIVEPSPPKPPPMTKALLEQRRAERGNDAS